MSTTPDDPPQKPPADELTQTDWPVTLDELEHRVEHRLEPTDLDELEQQIGLREPPRKPWLQRLLAPLIGLGLLLLKFGFFILKFFGIFVAVAAYTLIWGWRFAVGFVLLILVHELGHYVEAKLQGLDPQLPVFIPFLGAYVALRNIALRSLGERARLARRADRRRCRRSSSASWSASRPSPISGSPSPTRASC